MSEATVTATPVAGKWVRNEGLSKDYRRVMEWEGGEGKVRLRQPRWHEGQMAALGSKARFIAMLAGSQSGKTVLCPEWLAQEIEAKGAGDYLVGTATYPLMELKLLPEFMLLFRDILQMGEWRQSEKIFQFWGGKGRIIFFSATNPEAMESATAKAAVLDEAGQAQFQRQTWEAVQRRLATTLGRVLITTSLYYSGGWLKHDLYDKWRTGDKDIEVIQFDSTMNPIFTKGEYERIRKTMPAWKFDLMHRGRFSDAVGRVYSMFDRDARVVKRIPIPKEWFVHVGHDFGLANPAALFVAQDPGTGDFWLFNEYLPGRGRSVAQHVEVFKEITKGYRVYNRLGGNHQEDEARQAFAAHGWPIQEPMSSNAPNEQIKRVQGLMGLQRLYIFDDLEETLKELESYSYKMTDDYQVTDEIEDKARYHLLDAMRYVFSRVRPETATKYTPAVIHSLHFGDELVRARR